MKYFPAYCTAGLPSEPTRANTSRSQTLDDAGQVVTFTCDLGFAFSGSPVTVTTSAPTTTITTTTLLPLAWQTFVGAEWALVVESAGVTWEEASLTCEGHGGSLASITSWEIQKWINSQFGLSNRIWIGGSDSAEEGTFTWAGGDSWEYSNWNGCPVSNDNNKNCVAIKNSAAGRWQVLDCLATVRRYLCQRGAASSPLWTEIHGAEYSYLENNQCIRSWAQARAQCTGLGDGADLASLLSAEVISEYLGLFSSLITKSAYWIGLNDKDTEGTYVWTKGESFSYQHWDLWEPYAWGGDCAVALKNTGKWEMNDCNKNSNNGALCMKGTSTSIGAGPTPPPPPISNYVWHKRWNKNACSMQSLRKTGWQSFYGASCCEACQALSFSSPLDKISWKNKDCYCVGTATDSCDPASHLQAQNGWGSADCRQSVGRRRRSAAPGDQEDLGPTTEHFSQSLLSQFDHFGLIEAALRRKRSMDKDEQEEEEEEEEEVTGQRLKRSVNGATEREVTCEALFGGSALYWKYDFEVPTSCWSK